MLAAGAKHITSGSIAATRDPFRVQQPSGPCFLILTLRPLNTHTQGPEGSCLTTARATGHPQGKDSKANFSSLPSGPREPQEKTREAGRKKEEGDGGGAQKDIDERKKKATLGSQEVLSNSLQVVYFNQLEKA